MKKKKNPNKTTNAGLFGTSFPQAGGTLADISRLDSYMSKMHHFSLKSQMKAPPRPRSHGIRLNLRLVLFILRDGWGQERPSNPNTPISGYEAIGQIPLTQRLPVKNIFRTQPGILAARCFLVSVHCAEGLCLPSKRFCLGGGESGTWTQGLVHGKHVVCGWAIPSVPPPAIKLFWEINR
jgi:hypothetical protein